MQNFLTHFLRRFIITNMLRQSQSASKYCASPRHRRRNRSPADRRPAMTRSPYSLWLLPVVAVLVALTAATAVIRLEHPPGELNPTVTPTETVTTPGPAEGSSSTPAGGPGGLARHHWPRRFHIHVPEAERGLGSRGDPSGGGHGRPVRCIEHDAGRQLPARRRPGR